MNDLSKKHIETLQDFSREFAGSLDDDEDGRGKDLVDALRFAIERLSNQERIAAQTQHDCTIERNHFPYTNCITLRVDESLKDAAIGDRVTLIL